MKTITMSQRFYYHELDCDIKNAVRHDLKTYASMLHKAYRVLYDVCFHQLQRPQNLCKDLNIQYHTSDYMPLSAIHEAKALLKSNIECNKLQQKKTKKRIRRIEQKIKNNTNKIKRLDQQINEFIAKRKKGIYSEVDYLQEVQECKPKRKRILNQQKMLLFRLHKEQYHLINLQKRVKQTCFGGRKLMKSRTIIDCDHEKWYKDFQQARTCRMVIPR